MSRCLRFLCLSTALWLSTTIALPAGLLFEVTGVIVDRSGNGMFMGDAFQDGDDVTMTMHIPDGLGAPDANGINSADEIRWVENPQVVWNFGSVSSMSGTFLQPADFWGEMYLQRGATQIFVLAQHFAGDENAIELVGDNFGPTKSGEALSGLNFAGDMPLDFANFPNDASTSPETVFNLDFSAPISLQGNISTTEFVTDEWVEYRYEFDATSIRIVPEPTTASLAGLGLVWLLRNRRRQAR